MKRKQNRRRKKRQTTAITYAIGRRSDGRPHDTGTINPYRPKPRDFREVYISIGWEGIVDHYRTNWRVVRRWIEEEGRDVLREARAQFVAAKNRAAQPYRIGKHLTAVKSDRPKR